MKGGWCEQTQGKTEFVSANVAPVSLRHHCKKKAGRNPSDQKQPGLLQSRVQIEEHSASDGASVNLPPIRPPPKFEQRVISFWVPPGRRGSHICGLILCMQEKKVQSGMRIKDSSKDRDTIRKKGQEARALEMQGNASCAWAFIGTNSVSNMKSTFFLFADKFFGKSFSAFMAYLHFFRTFCA